MEYRVNQPISVEQFIHLLAQTSLGERRPLNDHTLIQGMLDHTDLLVTAWDGDSLVGVARSVTDFHYCCYMSELAVSKKVQSQGLGTQLIIETFKQLTPGCKLNLLAAPDAVKYYPHIGFTPHHSAWILADLSQIQSPQHE
ncbi:GNAT family N-acetyltransferase [Vibrio aphrogenes]|uniref:GNAT family N-acetyltransferase n=1 Tax=Vibrio aphrogenes TaxID=1891186 RepID=UPI000B362FD9|nr:GNAT family N-acetyltransferase [Vibrio aphrogenes]